MFISSSMGALITDNFMLFLLAVSTICCRDAGMPRSLCFSCHLCSIHSVIALVATFLHSSRIAFAAQAHFGRSSDGVSHRLIHLILVASHRALTLGAPSPPSLFGFTATSQAAFPFFPCHTNFLIILSISSRCSLEMPFTVIRYSTLETMSVLAILALAVDVGCVSDHIFMIFACFWIISSHLSLEVLMLLPYEETVRDRQCGGDMSSVVFILLTLRGNLSIPPEPVNLSELNYRSASSERRRLRLHPRFCLNIAKMAASSQPSRQINLTSQIVIINFMQAVSDMRKSWRRTVLNGIDNHA